MLIILEKLRNKKINVLDLKFCEKIDSIRYYDKVLKISNPVSIVGKISNTDQGMYLECNIDVTLKDSCARCLKELEINTNYDVQGFLVKNESDVLEEEDTFVYNGDEFDLMRVLEDTLILNVPQSVLCSEDCKGLCPVCGCDLNENDCDCNENNQEQMIDPRFAKLKDLFKND